MYLLEQDLDDEELHVGVFLKRHDLEVPGVDAQGVGKVLYIHGYYTYIYKLYIYKLCMYVCMYVCIY
jgi:hypothetical protein